jgi:Holliday junction DNA helicase RuvA
MIGYVHGTLAYRLPHAIVVDTGGVGYEIFVPDNSRLLLAREGDEVRIFTAMIVKEDEMSLYGFPDRDSVGLFRLLLTVSGVGAKAAMAILSAMSAEQAVRAITFGDATLLTKANGVGKKGAERIILELSDKVGKLPGGAQPEGGVPQPASGGAEGEAIEVLLSLGYSRSEAGAAVLGIAEEGLSAEELVKRALRSMG